MLVEGQPTHHKSWSCDWKVGLVQAKEENEQRNEKPIEYLCIHAQVYGGDGLRLACSTLFRLAVTILTITAITA